MPVWLTNSRVSYDEHSLDMSLATLYPKHFDTSNHFSHPLADMWMDIGGPGLAIHYPDDRQLRPPNRQTRLNAYSPPSSAFTSLALPQHTSSSPCVALPHP